MYRFHYVCPDRLTNRWTDRQLLYSPNIKIKGSFYSDHFIPVEIWTATFFQLSVKHLIEFGPKLRPQRTILTSSFGYSPNRNSFQVSPPQFPLGNNMVYS